jgi:Effector-associated domain 11
MSDLNTIIRTLVAADKLEQAIETLHDYLRDQDSELTNELIAHKAVLTKATRDSRRGMIPTTQEDQTRMRIRYAILDLLSDLEDSEGKRDTSSEKTLNIDETPAGVAYERLGF